MPCWALKEELDTQSRGAYVSRDRGPTSPKGYARPAGTRHRGPYCQAGGLPKQGSDTVRMEGKKGHSAANSGQNLAWEDNWRVVALVQEEPS